MKKYSTKLLIGLAILIIIVIAYWFFHDMKLGYIEVWMSKSVLKMDIRDIIIIVIIYSLFRSSTYSK